MNLLRTLPRAAMFLSWGVLVVVLLYSLVVLVWQLQVLRGKAMKNPDGSSDDWREQPTHFGIAVADVFIACPLCIAAFVLVLANSGWGPYLLGMVGFWFVWTNTMTTTTSLRFSHPRLSIQWYLTFPSGIVIGLAAIIWSAATAGVAATGGLWHGAMP